MHMFVPALTASLVAWMALYLCTFVWTTTAITQSRLGNKCCTLHSRQAVVTQLKTWLPTGLNYLTHAQVDSDWEETMTCP